MIFGFNTEVAYDGTVYHVQSEFRGSHEPNRLETQVFISGRCVGTRAEELGDHGRIAEPQVQDKIQEMLKTQHRDAVAAISAGRLDNFLSGNS
jgi:hypothetical protein